jgi:pimeloyl-ACP methyl ester carboxylesterase
VGAGAGGGGSLRIHYLDEGPADGEVVLLLHGEPSWSYLYRRMIPVLVEAGLRCIAPDLVGFGRSDKPSEQTDYTYARHVEWMRAALFDRIGLDTVTLVGQDWGGLIGLRLLGEHPERFARVVLANSGLPTGDQPLSEAFLAWQRYAATSPRFHIGGIVNGGCTSDLDEGVVAAYDAPFPDDAYTAGRPTGRRGPRWARSRAPSSPRSRTATPSPAAATPSSSAWSPEPRDSPTPRSPAAATSSRRTGGPSWPGSSPTSSRPLLHADRPHGVTFR